MRPPLSRLGFFPSPSLFSTVESDYATLLLIRAFDGRMGSPTKAMRSVLASESILSFSSNRLLAFPSQRLFQEQSIGNEVNQSPPTPFPPPRCPLVFP